jgi:hypothetical protein
MEFVSAVCCGNCGSRNHDLRLDGELALSVCSHKCRTQPIGPQTQAALTAPADIMYKCHTPLAHLLLVEELILNCIQIDKVAHGSTRVPTDPVSVDVDLTQQFDHLILVGRVGFCARCGGSVVVVLGVLVVGVGIGGGCVDCGEGKGVCDLEHVGYIHTDEETGRSGWEGLRAVLDEFHHDLWARVSMPPVVTEGRNTYKRFDLDGAKRCVRHDCDISEVAALGCVKGLLSRLWKVLWWGLKCGAVRCWRNSASEGDFLLV